MTMCNRLLVAASLLGTWKLSLACVVVLAVTNTSRAITFEYEFTSTGAVDTWFDTSYYSWDENDEYWTSPILSSALDAVPWAGVTSSDWNRLTNGTTTIGGTFRFALEAAPANEYESFAEYEIEFEASSAPAANSFKSLIEAFSLYQSPTLDVTDWEWFDAVQFAQRGILDLLGPELTLDFMEVLDTENSPLPTLEHFPVRAKREWVEGQIVVTLHDDSSSMLTNTSPPASLDIDDFTWSDVWYQESDYWSLDVDPSDYADEEAYEIAADWLDGNVDFFYRTREIYYDLADLELIDVSAAGDLNGDGSVDAADYVMWRKNPGLGSYAQWVREFGASGWVGSGGAVPEPSVLVSVAMVLGALIVMRNRASNDKA